MNMQKWGNFSLKQGKLNKNIRQKELLLNWKSLILVFLNFKSFTLTQGKLNNNDKQKEHLLTDQV